MTTVKRYLPWLLAVVAVAIASYLCIHGGLGVDISVYRNGSRVLLHGGSLYEDVSAGGYPFTYPPFAAVVLLPFLVAPASLAFIAWKLITAAALFWVARIVAVRMPALSGGAITMSSWTLTWLIFAFSLVTEPVLENFRFGQINIVLLAMLLFDTVTKSRWTGILTGVAAGIKVTPGVFIVFMLVTRRWADALRASAAFAATILVGALFGPAQEWRYWTAILFDTSRVGETDRSSNASLGGILARWLPEGASTVAWLTVALVVLVAGLVIAARWWPLDRLAAACTVGLTGLLITPIAWVHHWVWLVPTAAVLLALSLRRTAQASRGRWLVVCAFAAVSITELAQVRRGLPFLLGAKAGDTAPLNIIDTLTSLYSGSSLIALAALAFATRGFDSTAARAPTQSQVEG